MCCPSNTDRYDEKLANKLNYWSELRVWRDGVRFHHKFITTEWIRKTILRLNLPPSPFFYRMLRQIDQYQNIIQSPVDRTVSAKCHSFVIKMAGCKSKVLAIVFISPFFLSTSLWHGERGRIRFSVGRQGESNRLKNLLVGDNWADQWPNINFIHRQSGHRRYLLIYWCFQ